MQQNARSRRIFDGASLWLRRTSLLRRRSRGDPRLRSETPPPSCSERGLGESGNGSRLFKASDSPLWGFAQIAISATSTPPCNLGESLKAKNYFGGLSPSADPIVLRSIRQSVPAGAVIVEPQRWMASSAALRRSHSRFKPRLGRIWLTKD